MQQAGTAILLVLALAIHQGAAIKCYTCTSKSNADCVDPRSSDMKPSECLPSMAWSSKDLNDVLPGSVSKMFDSISTGLSNLAGSIPVQMVCLKSNIKSGEETIIMRHCAAASTDTDKDKGSVVCDQIRKAADGKSEFCGVCDYDGCNSAPRSLSISMALLLAPLMLLLAKF